MPGQGGVFADDEYGRSRRNRGYQTCCMGSSRRHPHPRKDGIGIHECAGQDLQRSLTSDPVIVMIVTDIRPAKGEMHITVTDEDIAAALPSSQKTINVTIEGVGEISKLVQCRKCRKAVNTKVDGKLYFCPSCKINMPHNRVERQFIIPLDCGASHPQLKATRDVLFELPSLAIDQTDDDLMIALLGLGEVKLVYNVNSLFISSIISI
ncbi:hypothetical protein CAPTEDRAFT_219779 [Capitella teleta]|uniref:Uncharacterized protein n=1 Tax=Capitella teleta TaxID=283909 RepID=R7UP40_CAPTE|nr:hypothetical protein CAPTEDRAFT_219779 [Capitella teleta]|eukprot:ELU08294.1 hypothetical protein CAPTEDRAFT_219779 [Capitella teleta]